MSHHVRFSTVLAVGEYRAVLGAATASWVGDVMAKAALTYLVFVQTGSVVWSAAMFAVGFFPWVIGGPLLSALAERYPFRRTMIICDLVRMVVMGLVALVPLPLPALLVMLFVTSLCTPPFESARSALIPQLLQGEVYVVSLALYGVVAQAAQFGGYFLGGVVAALNPRLALTIDAAAFALSALLIWRGVRPRPSPMTEHHRSTLLKEAAEGFSVVFGHPLLRAIALLVFPLATFPVLPEGLAAAWTAALGGGPLAQGVLMAVIPLAAALGGVVMARLVPKELRVRVILPAAVAAPAMLVGALAAPPYPVVLVLCAAASFLSAGATIACNGLFVEVLPEAYRARAFGIMQGGLFVVQGVAVAAGGAVGTGLPVSTVVGWWCLGGVALMAAVALTWPRRYETKSSSRA